MRTWSRNDGSVSRTSLSSQVFGHFHRASWAGLGGADTKRSPVDPRLAGPQSLRCPTDDFYQCRVLRYRSIMAMVRTSRDDRDGHADDVPLQDKDD